MCSNACSAYLEGVEFDTFRLQAGSNTFTVPHIKWIEAALPKCRVRALRKALRDYPGVSFEVKEIGGGVELSFKKLATTPDQPQQKIGSEKSSEKSSEKILSLLKATSDMTTKALAEHLGISHRAVEKQIEKLKREGQLERIGPDKGGHWQVNKINN
jgi:predicted HTH transcriptional regulator